MENTDKELIFRYLNGHVDALEALVNRYRGPLFGYIMNMTGNQHDAEDIFQEVWFKAIKKLGIYANKNFMGWLVRISHNLVIDRARKRKPDYSLDREGQDGRPMVDVLPGVSVKPFEQLSDDETGVRIKRAIDALPVEQKEVFLMRTQSDLPFKEIAKIQKVSINTALARMQYALAGLRGALKEVYNEL